MVIELDGNQMTDRASAHDHLARLLDFPNYYGRNLDALYDLLTERGEETTIVLKRAELVSGPMVRTLLDAAERNPKLQIILA